MTWCNIRIGNALWVIEHVCKLCYRETRKIWKICALLLFGFDRLPLTFGGNNNLIWACDVSHFWDYLFGKCVGLFPFLNANWLK